jgi:hypothetical protein
VKLRLKALEDEEKRVKLKAMEEKDAGLSDVFQTLSVTGESCEE